MFPLAAFDLMDDREADALLRLWEHWLGGCARPFGRQSFGLWVRPHGLVAVAVSASTVGATCGGMPRRDVVELARLCAAPEHRWATRLALRLWRETAPGAWPHWPVRACVSYQNAARHSGNIYRFDGWRRAADVAGSSGGGTWTKSKAREAKVVWVWDVAPAAVPA